MSTIYLCGPMAGYPDLNRAAFEAAGGPGTAWPPAAVPDHCPTRQAITDALEEELEL